MNDYDYLISLGLCAKPHAGLISGTRSKQKTTLYRINKPPGETIILGNAPRCSKLDTWRR